MKRADFLDRRFNWSDFDRFNDTTSKYLPDMGEGDNKATQASTAICKLTYKWFNDGDVFDNTHYLEGWANDLSSYANWLNKHVDGASDILEQVDYCFVEEDYTALLYKLNELLTAEVFEELAKQPVVGTVYDCDGPYKFREESYDDEDNW